LAPETECGEEGSTEERWMNIHADLTETRMLIGGELVASNSGAWLDSIDPATEERIGRAPAADAGDVGRAVAAAEAAFPAWAALEATERASMLRAVAARLREEADDLLTIEVRDTGNTIGKVRRDVATAGDALDFFAGLAMELKGETIPASAANLHLTVREPYGVVGRIVPFNHPLKFAARALAAPLMAGNTVVVKPPEQSPLSAGALARICRDVLPPGVANIVTGSGIPAGDALVRHPAVKRLAFTGSVATGMAVQRAAAETCVKHVTLELGGKNPRIAFPDVAAERIAELAVEGMNFAWQGQSCGSTSRLLVHESQYEEVLERVADRVSAIRIGDPLDPASEMGPLNSRAHYERVVAMVEAGVAEGAQLVTGGERPPGSEFRRGFWLKPTVFANVRPGMRIAQEEIFGPVLSVIRWQSEAEAIEIANGTAYGLTAAILTNDLKAAFRVARAMRAGYVWINGMSRHYRGTPFGGYRNSGVGREEGVEELLSYSEAKTIHVILE
jgi:acyl-CoA reductase-like NAD-dependent aldehyde dehydrogenase